MECKVFLQELDEVYEIIVFRKKQQEKNNIKSGYLIDNITFEDIDLDDVFLSRLIPLFRPILEYYSSSSRKASTVFIAILCEVAKNGFPQGGILKTIDEYIGSQFNIQRYYQVLKKSLENEGIKIKKNFGHKYQETIICEAGIPRRLHPRALKLFVLYWKWMKKISPGIRHEELIFFIENGYFNNEYILDIRDYYELKAIVSSSDFSQSKNKLLKICLKLEEIYSALDNYDEIIDESNIDYVCDNISECLGYNILTVIRSKELKDQLVIYSRQAGFSKFEKILNNLNYDEEITLPTKKKINRRSYHRDDYICGQHIVRGVIYDVSYSIGLSLEEILSLDLNQAHKVNDNYLYLSKYPFEVEIDGQLQNIRELIYGKNNIYIYAGKIPSATISYIDGIEITSIEKEKLICSVRKHWNPETKKNSLGVHIKEFSYFDRNDATKELKINCYNKVVTRRINSNGYRKLRDVWFELDGTEKEGLIKISVDEKDVITKTILCENLLIYGTYNGLAVNDNIDVLHWFGDNSIIIFSKKHITERENIDVEFLYGYGEYKVYSGNFDLSKAYLRIDDRTIKIKNKEKPHLNFNCEFKYFNEKLVVNDFNCVSFKLENYCGEYENSLIKIYHDSIERTTKIDDINNIENFKLEEICMEPQEISGEWEISFVKEQTIINSIQFIILPKLTIENISGLVSEGEKSRFRIIADCKCFEEDGENYNMKVIETEGSNLNFEGIRFYAQELKQDIYIDKCGIWIELRLLPRIWGIRYKEKSSETYIKSESVSLEYRDIEKFEMLICSSGVGDIDILSSEVTEKRYLSEGYSRINVFSYINNWRKVNIIRIKDHHDAEKEIKILYRPQILGGIKFDGNAEGIDIKVKYDGPLGVNTTVIAFEKYDKVGKTNIITKKNKEIISILIPNANSNEHEDREISLEGRFDNGDNFTIGELQLKGKKIEKVEEIALKDYMKIYKIFKTDFDNRVIVNISNNIRVVDILNFVEEKNEI